MADWWKKGVAFPSNNPNFLRIIDFYLFNCPVQIITHKNDGTKNCELVSRRAVTFEDKDWIGGNITTLYTEITRNLTVECIEKDGSVEETRLHTEETSTLNDRYFDMIIYKKDWRINKTKSIFYSIRNSLAHGAFSVVNNGGNPVYYFENEKNGIKAQIRLKESTLLKWIELFNSSAQEIRKNKNEKLKKKVKKK